MWEIKFPFRLLTANIADADMKTPIFAREHYWVCTIEYIRSGHGVLETDGKNFSPGPGDIYILHKGSTHRYWPDRADPWKKYFFVVDGELMTSLFRIYHLDKVSWIPKCAHLRKYFETFVSLRAGANDVSEWADRKASVVFHEFVHSLSEHLYGERENAPEAAMHLREKLDSSLEIPFVLEHYARSEGVTSAHLIRVFRTAFGLTPCEYLLSRRIESAKRLLAYSALSIKEISCLLAFSDQYYFSNYFKKRTGLSPLDFRRKS